MTVSVSMTVGKTQTLRKSCVKHSSHTKVSEFNGGCLHHTVQTKCRRSPRDIFLCQKYFHLFSVIDQYFAFYWDTVDDKASAKQA